MSADDARGPVDSDGDARPQFQLEGPINYPDSAELTRAMEAWDAGGRPRKGELNDNVARAYINACARQEPPLPGQSLQDQLSALKALCRAYKRCLFWAPTTWTVTQRGLKYDPNKDERVQRRELRIKRDSSQVAKARDDLRASGYAAPAAWMNVLVVPLNAYDGVNFTGTCPDGEKCTKSDADCPCAVGKRRGKVVAEVWTVWPGWVDDRPQPLLEDVIAAIERAITSLERHFFYDMVIPYKRRLDQERLKTIEGACAGLEGPGVLELKRRAYAGELPIDQLQTELLDRLRNHRLKVPGPSEARDGAAGSLPSDDALLSAADLARIHGLPVNRVQQRLRRWRHKHSEGWQETNALRVTEPRILYRYGAVKELFPPIRRLRAPHTSVTRGKPKG